MDVYSLKQPYWNHLNFKSESNVKIFILRLSNVHTLYSARNIVTVLFLFLNIAVLGFILGGQ